MENIYITAAEPHTRKSLIALGMMKTLLQNTDKVAFFRPILQPFDDSSPDNDINLILSYFELNMSYDDAYGITPERARELLSSGQRDQMIGEILFKYQQLESKYDFILCQGTDFFDYDAAFEFELNAEIALNLGGAMITIVNGKNRSANEITTFSKLTLSSLKSKGLDNYALVINRCDLTSKERKEIIDSLEIEQKNTEKLTVFVLPEDKMISMPLLDDVLQQIDCTMLSGHDRIKNPIEHIMLAAGTTDNFIKDIKNGSLVLVPFDRTDIILAAITSNNSTTCPDIAGLLICGKQKLSTQIQDLLKGVSNLPLPILSTGLDTLDAALKLTSLYSRVTPKDSLKISLALDSFEKHVKIEQLLKTLIETKSHKVSPKMMELRLIEFACRKKTHIVLPEGDEERTLQAVDFLLSKNAVHITLLGDEQVIRSKASQLKITLEGANIINPSTASNLEDYIDTYQEMRKHKGITRDQAREKMIDPIYYGTMMLYKREADGLVSGAVHTTANTIRPAFEIIKTQPGVKSASSVFLMCMQNQVFIFGDCAINVDPTPEELAGIALSSVETAKLFDIDPRVAMLSYSTGTSGHGADVEKVAQATEIVKKAAPNMAIEGPIQYDAAVDPETAKIKLPNSKVAGKATVFIFPDLNTGNNTYKAVQRAANAVAMGPLIQGLNLPVNDLSRGATVPDIVNTIAITAIQAQSSK